MSTNPPDPDEPYGQAPPPPPGGGYQHIPGQPAYGSSAPMSDADQRMWATLCHLSGLLFGFVGPLVIFLVLKDRGHFIRNQSLEALNFQITITLAAVVSAILIIVVIGLLLLLIVAVWALVQIILAAIASNRGEEYRYPFTLRLVN